MLSIPDMALLGAAALLLFGPEQLPRVARKAGNVMREIQNTSSAFIREMERAADLAEAPRPSVYDPVAPYEPPAPDPAPYDVLHEPVEPAPPEPAAYEPPAHEAAEPGPDEPSGPPGLHAPEATPERDHTPHV